MKVTKKNYLFLLFILLNLLSTPLKVSAAEMKSDVGVEFEGETGQYKKPNVLGGNKGSVRLPQTGEQTSKSGVASGALLITGALVVFFGRSRSRKGVEK